MPKQITDAELDLVEGMSSRKAAEFLGVGKSTINDARAARRSATVAAVLGSEGATIEERYGVDDAKIIRRKVSERDPDTGSWNSVEWGPNGKPGLIEIARAVTPKVIAPKIEFAGIGGTWKTGIVVADEQYGFRGDDPFHDDRAINVAWAIMAGEDPQQIVHAGDFLDLATLGRFELEPELQGGMQKAFDRGNTQLAMEREVAPGADIVLVEGNHDRRMQRFANDNAPDVQRLRAANTDAQWPALSVPGLLRCDDLNVQYMDAYPTATWWINDNLRVIHGTKVNSKGSTAQRYADEMPHISTVFGHTHRREILSRTTFTRYDKIESSYINPGCLCRVDGGVPSVKGAVGINGESALAWEDWQQGVAVIRYKDSGEFRAELVQISDGMAIYQGQEIIG